MRNRRITLLVAALLVAVDIAAGGWFVGNGFRLGRASDRYVTVKGISERDVKADLALWPLRFVASGDDLQQVEAKIRHDASVVMKFLVDNGIPQSQTELQSLDVTDRTAQPYNSGQFPARFIVAQTLIARTADVAKMQAASQHVDQLVDSGVILSNDFGPGSGGPSYLFTGLTALKPDMIAEATKNARAAAEKFAADSGSSIGGIRIADQGLFQILPRDDASGLSEEKQVNKTIRVVSTIQYYLVK